MRSGPITCALVLLTLGLSPELTRGGPSNGASFSHPLLITNPFFPFPDQDKHLVKGMVGTEGTVELAEYAPRTRTFTWNGEAVETRTVFEWEFFFGLLLEASANYYAQADDGSVYYFGEVVKSFGGGGGADELSWLVGGPTLPSDPEAALTATAPALFMPGEPVVGGTWKPEDLAPLLEEQATVLAMDQTVRCAFGQVDGCLLVHLASGQGDEHLKYFAPGMGEVLEQYPEESFVLAGVAVLQ